MSPKDLNKSDHQRRVLRKIWMVLGILFLLTPLGVIVHGTAWGEWTPEELRSQLGYLPEGLERMGKCWKALLAHYSIPSLQSRIGTILSHLISTLIGLGLISFITYILGIILSSKKE